jgi:hypothetical protein
MPTLDSGTCTQWAALPCYWRRCNISANNVVRRTCPVQENFKGRAKNSHASKFQSKTLLRPWHMITFHPWLGPLIPHCTRLVQKTNAAPAHYSSRKVHQVLPLAGHSYTRPPLIPHYRRLVQKTNAAPAHYSSCRVHQVPPLAGHSYTKPPLIPHCKHLVQKTSAAKAH